MNRFFLRRLQIEGFRGINNEGDPLDLRFRPDAINSIFGRNAGGKSSVFEALWFAIHGSVPKLRRLPVADHPEEYLRNRFHSGTAIVLITLQPDDNSANVVSYSRKNIDNLIKKFNGE